MEKVLFSLLVVLGLSFSVGAQTEKLTAVSESKTELTTSKTTGVYKFELPNRTAEDIEKSAQYYTHYFSVDFDESTNVATLTLTESEMTNRAVIARFLVAAKMSEVSVDGQSMPVMDFMEEYLK